MQYVTLSFLILCNVVTALQMLSGKRVLVSGAGRGIGRAIAQICFEEGAQVAICSRNETELKETITEALSSCATSSDSSTSISNSMMDYYVVDLKQKSGVDNMVTRIVKKWGGIDILINNAGRNQAEKKPTYELDGDDLKDLLDLNVVAVHTLTSSVLRQSMLSNNSGKIVNISSKAGKVGISNMGFYVSSKFALEGYSASLSEELKDKNIKVNTISPGMVDTISFPKAPGRKGVRSAKSVKAGLMLLLETEKTGHYVHVDELDEVLKKKMDKSFALKPINEEAFMI